MGKKSWFRGALTLTPPPSTPSFLLNWRKLTAPSSIWWLLATKSRIPVSMSWLQYILNSTFSFPVCFTLFSIWNDFFYDLYRTNVCLMTKNGVWAERIDLMVHQQTCEKTIYFFKNNKLLSPHIARSHFLSLFTHTKSTIFMLKNLWKPLLNTCLWLAIIARAAGINSQWEERLKGFSQ